MTYLVASVTCTEVTAGRNSSLTLMSFSAVRLLFSAGAVSGSAAGSLLISASVLDRDFGGVLVGPLGLLLPPTEAFFGLLVRAALLGFGAPAAALGLAEFLSGARAGLLLLREELF